ncbi:MAG: hypothetical protein KC729_13600, partial [Candidatus Eisenbacteria bacterium]|nr:hypothetical protein [Candidatus Eisenbacteria bacterium]
MTAARPQSNSRSAPQVRRWTWICVAASLVVPGLARAYQSFSEDFTTTTYEDTDQTTANWNTAQGVLQLPTFPLSLNGSTDTPDIANDLTIAGDYAYVADRNSGLQVIDISDPASPVLVGTLDTPHQAEGVSVDGDYAFVAD